MTKIRSQYDRRGNRPRREIRIWHLLALMLLVSVAGSLYRVARLYPIESLIFAAVIALAVVGVILYIWHLTIIAWLVEFVCELGVPKLEAISVSLDYEQVGEIIVVNLGDNIATERDCQAVETRLKELIGKHYCNFVLDFADAGRISVNFRETMIALNKAAHKEAVRLGRPDRLAPLPYGEVFRVFDDRSQAVEEMSEMGGHGWVVPCSVPVGTRAVFGE